MSTLPRVDFFLLSNLSPTLTGLPFVVWISPKAGARHDVRVKVSPGPKTRPAELISISLRPEISEVGRASPRLSSKDFALLKRWIELNFDVLVAFWDGDIEYTEDVLKSLKPLRVSK